MATLLLGERGLYPTRGKKEKENPGFLLPISLHFTVTEVRAQSFHPGAGWICMGGGDPNLLSRQQQNSIQEAALHFGEQPEAVAEDRGKL